MRTGLKTFKILGFIECGFFALEYGIKVDGYGFCFFDKYCYTSFFGWEKL
jgi:hypothetical protein